MFSSTYFRSAVDDLDTYRNDYPGQSLNQPNLKDNLEFYRGDLRCRPDGMTVQEIHAQWWGAYDVLEERHGFIQWLFPIHEGGMNWQAQVLQRHEKAAICASPELQRRVLASYELMLDFYGMRLVDSAAGLGGAGAVARSANWRSRYQNLNLSGHNYLRITRILKCLGEMGLERFKLPFLTHVYEEIIVHGQLGNCWSSVVRYWAPTLRRPADQAALSATADVLAEDAAAAKEAGRTLQPPAADVGTAHAAGAAGASDLMNVIFLDVDGVLANSRSMLADYEPDDQTLVHDPSGMLLPLEKRCCQQLRRIVDSCPPTTVVISSTWRLEPSMRHFLVSTLRNVGVEVADGDNTPDLGDRGGEVKAWLKAHQGKVAKFAIIDDSHTSSFEREGLIDHLVQTVMRDQGGDSLREGLTATKADDVIRLLTSFDIVDRSAAAAAD